MARCGRCREHLGAPPNGRKRGRALGLISLLFLASVGVVDYLVSGKQLRPSNTGTEGHHAKAESSIFEPADSLSEGSTSIPEPKPPPSFDELNAPPVAISTGLVRTRTGRERIAPLEIGPIRALSLPMQLTGEMRS